MHRLSLQPAVRTSRAVFVKVLCVACTAAALPVPGGAAPPSGTAGAANGRLARSHLDNIAALAKSHADQALCSAVLSADQLQQSLGQEFQHRRDAIYERSPDNPQALQRLDLAVAEARARLPGVGLSVGAENIYHYVSYRALAAYVPRDSAAARTLRLAGDIWHGPAGDPISFEPGSDVTGCWRPSAVVAALRSLAAVWPSAPSCLQSHLRPKLGALQEQLAGVTCYCEDEKKTASALAEIGRLNKVFTGSVAKVTPGSHEQPQQERSYLCR